MNFERIHQFIDTIAKGIEVLGVTFVVVGIILASWTYLKDSLSQRDWSTAFRDYRSNLARGILLGLEMLVGADIISTITAPLSGQSVLLLGGIVLIRTFLSFSLETEIEGCWPWQRARLKNAG